MEDLAALYLLWKSGKKGTIQVLYLFLLQINIPVLCCGILSNFGVVSHDIGGRYCIKVIILVQRNLTVFLSLSLKMSVALIKAATLD